MRKRDIVICSPSEWERLFGPDTGATTSITVPGQGGARGGEGAGGGGSGSGQRHQPRREHRPSSSSSSAHLPDADEEVADTGEEGDDEMDEEW